MKLMTTFENTEPGSVGIGKISIRGKWRRAESSERKISFVHLTAKAAEEFPYEQVYTLCDESRSAAALDVVYARLNKLLVSDDFEVVDAILNSVDIDRLDVATGVGFLSITLPASKILRNRSGYITRFQQAFAEQLPATRLAKLVDRLK